MKTKINTPTIYSLILCQLLILFPLINTLYPFIIALVLLGHIWCLGYHLGKLRLPHQLFVNLTILLITGVIVIVEGAGQFIQLMINLLYLSLGYRLLTIEQLNDVKRLVLSQYFLIALGFIYGQSITYSGYILLIFSINTYVLLYNYTPRLNEKKRIQFLVTMFAQTLPVVAVLFIVIPRMGPMWKMNNPQSATVGLSETVKPGDIAKVAQSANLAFRATFTTPPPLLSDLYWRAIVQEEFDGESWTIHPFRQSRYNLMKFKPMGAAKVNELIISRYSIIAEPSYQTWLYSLDTPIASSNNILFHGDKRLSKASTVTQKFQYDVSSALNLNQTIVDFTGELAINLQLPEGLNPKTKALAQRLYQQTNSPAEYVKSVLDYFRTQPFYYSLQPPLLTEKHEIDQFLLQTQTGFCTHYASSFAVMMRSVGIPARIVSGYLGGKYSPDQQFVSIYQFDAHAWNEVWLDGQGWTRVDPTAAIAPDRILYGAQSLSNEDNFLSQETFSLHKYQHFAAFQWMTVQLEIMDFYWSSWVVGFDRQQKQQLWQRMKNISFLQLSFYLISGILLLTGLLILFRYWRRYRQPFSAKRLQRELLALAELASLKEVDNLAPISLLEQLQQQRPQFTTQWQLLIVECTNLLYKVSDSKRSWSAFKQHCQQLKKQLK